MIGVTSFSNNGQSFKSHIGAENHHWNPAQREEKAEGYCIKSWLFPKLCLQIPAWNGCWEEEMWLEARHHWEGRSQPGESSKVNYLVEITRECQDHGVTVSRATIHRWLRRWATAAAFQWPSPFWTPSISRSVSSGQQKGRIGWWLTGQKCSSQIKAIFVSHFGNKGPRVWRLPGEENQPGCIKSSVKFPQSVMVWMAATISLIVITV